MQRYLIRIFPLAGTLLYLATVGCAKDTGTATDGTTSIAEQTTIAEQDASTEQDASLGKLYFTEESVNEYISVTAGHDGSKLIARLRTHLPDGSSVLELGMGPGKDLDILLESYKTTGSDISPIFIERYRKKRPDADLMMLDAVSLQTTRTFNGIYSNKVLHHLTDEELKKSIKQQTRILSDHGVICHSFWMGDKDFKHGGFLFNSHTEPRIKEMFQESFQILHLESYQAVPSKSNQEMKRDDSILIIGRKR